MVKGFGQGKKKERSPAYVSIETQINAILSTDVDGGFVFTTTQERAKILKHVCWRAAQTVEDKIIQVNTHEYEYPKAFISAPLEKFNYAWVEESQLTKKWLVNCCPPGGEYIRALTVWRDRADAEYVAKELLPIIKSFPYKEWDKHRQSKMYLELLDFLPEDDDEVLAVVGGDGQTEIVTDIPEVIKVLNSDEGKELLKEKLAEAMNQYNQTES